MGQPPPSLMEKAVLTCTTVDWGERRTVGTPKGNLPASRIWLRLLGRVDSRLFPFSHGVSRSCRQVPLCVYGWSVFAHVIFQLPSLNRARHPKQYLRGRGRFFPPMPD